MSKQSKSERSPGDLKRNNVYSQAAVLDWACRIPSGNRGGLKLNEKFMLIVIAMSSNPIGVCELPVRFLADHLGVGLRQAQRLIVQLQRYDLVRSVGLPPVGRPVDIVRKLVLNMSVDPDTWDPRSSPSTKMPLMRRMTKETLTAFYVALEPKVSAVEFEQIMTVQFLGVRSRQLDFVSGTAHATNAVYLHQKTILTILSNILKVPVLRVHLIPRPGYR